MKKLLSIIITLLIIIPIFAQHSQIEYKNFLKENNEIFIEYGFESYFRLTFKEDSTFSIDGFDYHFCDGTYSMANDKITIEYPFNYIHEEKREYLKDFGLKINSESEIKIDLDICNLFRKGAYISGDKIFWSKKESEPYKEYEYNGIRCIKYPIKIKINENLKIRKTPSLQGELVHIDYFNSETEVFYEDRTIIFQGEIYRVIAKTINNETIDGITAPWYLITVYGAAFDSQKVENAWIFGGYVTEIK